MISIVKDDNTSENLYRRSEEDIDIFKKNLLLELEKFDNSDTLNCVTVNNTVLVLRNTDRTSIKQAIPILKSMGENVITIWSNLNAITLSLDDAEDLINKVTVRGEKIFQITANKKLYINKEDDIEMLRNFNISDGYPDNLNLEYNM